LGHLTQRIDYVEEDIVYFKITQKITDNPFVFVKELKYYVHNLMVGDLINAYMNDYKPIKNIIQGIFINRSNCIYVIKNPEGHKGHKGPKGPKGPK